MNWGEFAAASAISRKIKEFKARRALAHRPKAGKSLDPERTGPRLSAGPRGLKRQTSVLVVLVATLTGILGLLAGLLATALLLAGLVLAAALLMLTALTALATLLVLTALTGMLRVLVLWILAHRYSLQLPNPNSIDGEASSQILTYRI
jgi:hypothetical protein